MNKRNKILTFAVISTLILALNIVPAVSSNNSSDVVSLADVIESTTSRNSELNLYDKKIKIADEEYEIAKDNRNENTSSHLENARREEIYPDQKKQALEDIKREKNNRESELVRESEQLYFEILIQDDLITMQQKIIDRLDKQLENKKKQIELGNAAQYTLTSDEVALKEAQNKLTSLKNEKEKKLMELNYKIGNDVDFKLNLKVQDIPEAKINMSNLDAQVNKLKENHYDIKSLNNKIRTKINEYDIIRDNAKDSDGAMQFKTAEDLEKDAENELTLMEYDLEDKKVELEYKAKTDYNNLLNLKEEIENKQLDCEKSKINLKAAKARYDVGFITEIDYDKAQEVVDAALIAYKQVQLKYYVAVEAFNDFIK